MRHLLRDDSTPTSTAASTPSPRRPPPRYEGARAKVAALHRRAVARRGRVHQERHRGASTWWPTSWGRRQPAARATPCVLTEIEHHANIVPWQHARRTSGASSCAGSRSTDDGHLDLTDLDRLLDGAKLLGVTAMSNVLGTLTPVRRARRRRPRRRRAASWSTPASTCPTSPPTWRRWAPTSSPSPATRCCGPTGIGVLWGREELLDAMPPFLGGGEMIRDVTPRRLHAQRPALEVRGRHAADRRGHRPRRRRRLPRRASAWTRSASTRSRSPPTPCAPSPSASATTLTHPRPGRAGRARRRALLRLPRHPPPRPVPGARRARRVRPGRPPLRQAADARCSASAPPPGRRVYVYNDEADVDALADALAAAGEFFAF